MKKNKRLKRLRGLQCTTGAAVTPLSHSYVSREGFSLLSSQPDLIGELLASLIPTTKYRYIHIHINIHTMPWCGWATAT
jgi:hypothetical protein